MIILVSIKSNISGRVVKGAISASDLLEMDEQDLVERFTICSCQPVGETYVVDCNCDLEWEKYELQIGDEVVSP